MRCTYNSKTNEKSWETSEDISFLCLNKVIEALKSNKENQCLSFWEESVGCHDLMLENIEK